MNEYAHFFFFSFNLDDNEYTEKIGQIVRSRVYYVMYSFSISDRYS